MRKLNGENYNGEKKVKKENKEEVVFRLLPLY